MRLREVCVFSNNYIYLLFIWGCNFSQFLYCTITIQLFSFFCTLFWHIFSTLEGLPYSGYVSTFFFFLSINADNISRGSNCWACDRYLWYLWQQGCFCSNVKRMKKKMAPHPVRPVVRNLVQESGNGVLVIENGSSWAVQTTIFSFLLSVVLLWNLHTRTIASPTHPVTDF